MILIEYHHKYTYNYFTDFIQTYIQCELMTSWPIMIFIKLLIVLMLHSSICFSFVPKIPSSILSPLTLFSVVNRGLNLDPSVFQAECLNLGPSVFLAECAMLCNTPPAQLITKLSSRERINMKCIVREVSSSATRYNIVDYEEKGTLKRVISVRGSTSFKNLQDSSDSSFEFDSSLDINIHKGFRRVYLSILEDLPPFVFEKFASDGRKIELSLTGHSLGGVISCLLGAAFCTRGIDVKRITVFGMPMFTDIKGTAKLANLSIERVQHLYDPIGLGPVVSNIDLVHVVASKEIFLKLDDVEEKSDERKEPEGFTFRLPSLPDLKNIFEYFGDYDRKGIKLENTDVSAHKVIIGRDTIRTSLSGLLDPDEGVLPNALKFHLKYHSMSKYLEVLKRKFVNFELQSQNASRQIN